MIKKLVPLTLLAAVLAAHAQPVPAPAGASAGKKDLVARILKLQQPGIEAMARNMAETPAAELMSRAGQVLPTRIAAERREAVAKEIQADARKYADEVVPFVQGRAVRLAPLTIGAMLEERMSEDELRQVVAIIESPTYIKFQQLGGDMQKVLTERLLTDTRPTVEPKVRALEQSIAKRLGVTQPAAPAAAPARPASPASR